MKFTHGAKADGRGGVIQAQGIRREVQGNEAYRGMAARHVRHQPGEKRPQQPGQGADDAGLFRDAKQAEPQRVRVPKSSTMISTESRAMSKSAPTMAENTSAWPPTSQRSAPVRAAYQEKGQPYLIEHRVARPMTQVRRQSCEAYQL